MGSIGVAAASGVRHPSKRINLSGRLLRRLPLVSAGLVGVLGAVVTSVMCQGDLHGSETPRLTPSGISSPVFGR